MEVTLDDLFKMAAPMNTAHEFPVSTKQVSAVINEHVTNVLCSNYEDRVFVIATQFNKLGTLVDVRRDIVDMIASNSPTFSIKVLLGKDEPLTHVFARNIVESMGVTKPVLVAISLKDTSPATLKEIKALVAQCKVWSGS